MAQKRNPKVQISTQKGTVVTTQQNLPVAQPEGTKRVVTPETGVPQDLAPIQLGQWLTEASSSKVQQAPTKGVPLRHQLPPARVTPDATIDIETETGANQATRKLTFSADSAAAAKNETRRNNRAPNRGKKLSYFPPVLKDGNKVVKLNLSELESQKRKWDNALIGYVVGKNPPFKQMLKFVYAIWNFVETPRVFLHEEGYYIFKFANEQDKMDVLQYGPYTFDYRPMVLKQWTTSFQMGRESIRQMPLWVTFPNLPIEYCFTENLGRIASFIGNLICTDRLTTEEERLSYARILIELDVTQPLPKQMLIEEANGKYKTQLLDYEWWPEYCQDCMCLGHVTQKCPVSQAATAKTDKAPPRVVAPARRSKQVPTQWQDKDAPNVQADSSMPEIPPEAAIPIEKGGQEDALGNKVQPLTSKARDKEKQPGETVATTSDTQNATSSLIVQTVAMSYKGRADKLRKYLGTEWTFYVDYNVEPNGRIWLCWKHQNVQLTILEAQTQSVHCYIEDKGSTFKAYMTFVYGLNTNSGRKDIRTHLRMLHTNMVEPWLILGDFNTGLSVHDRLNGAPERFIELVSQVWNQNIAGHTMFRVWKKLTTIGTQARKLNKEMSSLESRIKNLREQLLEDGIYEQVLRQKSRATWIAHGDSNIKFFHAHLKARQTRNRIASICDEQSVRITDPALIHQEFFTFFKQLLGTSAAELPCLDPNIARDGPCLTLDQQRQLLVPVTREVILNTLHSLPCDKSPGVDGFPAEFFKAFWPVIGEEVTNAILQFFENGRLLRSINCTTITLVPKVTTPNFVKEFRPIACCSTIYKLIAKIMTTKLKTVVDYLVGPSQSAFIEGRNILDNVVVAHELVKGYGQKHVSPRCFMKIDIRKAYDSVEWGFLKMVLIEFGLPNRMVEWVMTCVTTVSYSLVINGGLTERFQAKKGLRQGDPMPPYLFVLVMEYLNRSLKQLRHDPNLNYHPKCSRQELVHICFADDLIMCCRADKGSIQLMMKAFEHFSFVSGLQANLHKSSFYVAGVTDEFRDQILQEMRFTLGISNTDPITHLAQFSVGGRFSIKQAYVSFIPQLPRVPWRNLRRIGTWAEEIGWLSKAVNNTRPRANILGFIAAATVYTIWVERNARRFQAKARSNVQLIRDIILQLHSRGQNQCKWSRMLPSLNSYPV
ncbi:uncharacterized protein LOC132612182 [Lycium barbarum]|uniref:uncharacterized protein LOC132612182 n=1 Tax=Lycium barbarum TaxID=112863 RepID=UPI00293F5E16|nr:uncharacterized protein LOC132612182 [Lycium barbarum]